MSDSIKSDLKLERLLAVVASLEVHEPKRNLAYRVEQPELSKRKTLTTSHQWESLLWTIDTASAHGKHALRATAIALANIINSKALETLFFDARDGRNPSVEPFQLLWDESAAISHDGKSVNELIQPCKRNVSVLLNGAAVIPQPWERWRLQRAFQNLGVNRSWGPWRQDPNHIGIAWKPWPLVWVSNGNHSTMAALVRGGGKLTCLETYDFSPVLRAVRTDGKHWIRAHDNSVIAPIRSVPMAGIFVIGQRLIAMN